MTMYQKVSEEQQYEDMIRGLRNNNKELKKQRKMLIIISSILSISLTFLSGYTYVVARNEKAMRHEFKTDNRIPLELRKKYVNY